MARSTAGTLAAHAALVLALASCGLLALVALGLSGARDDTRGGEAVEVGGDALAAGVAADPTTAPDGYVRMEVEDVVGGESSHVVLLRSADREVFLPVWIGANEALAIHLRLDGQSAPRPLTHDLFESVLAQSGARVLKMHITELRESVYFGRLFLEQHGRRYDVDARPSDSIALAVGARAPIYVAKTVLQSSGIDGRALLEAVDRGEGEGAADDVPKSGRTL